MRTEEKDKIYLPLFIFALVCVVLNVYWFSFAFFQSAGLYTPVIREIFAKLYKGGLFNSTYSLKLWALGFLFFTFIVKGGKSVTTPWKSILITLGAGFVLFLFPFTWPVVYIMTTTAGFVLTSTGIAYAGRKLKSMNTDVNDDKETFEQCDEKIEDDMSVNIPIEYQYKKKTRKGWINVVMPHGGVMITGNPGTGKSYSIYGHFLDQMVRKGFCFCLYDYKYPELSTELYNIYLRHKDDFKADGSRVYPIEPKFHVINFDDPRYSERCNPIHPRYIKEPADASEIADLIMQNVNPGEADKKDFFFQSATVYIACCIWFLRCHDGGRYCDFPHLIELMGRNYKAVFKMLQQHEDLRVMMAPFANALAGKAQEQLQGQIASAQIPLARFASPSLYWVLSGDDFSLDANNPDDPKFICIGNNPDRQAIYGTTLALFTSRIFKAVNHKLSVGGKRNLPCGVLLDEMPTIYLKGIDNLIATARSNKVAIILGAQDETQLARDYSEKNAQVIFNTVGTVISGRVNGTTAKKLSETFGKEFREQHSETTGGESDTINRSFQMQERLSQSRIETLSQGYFCGKVADRVGKEVEKKLFCGKVLINQEKRDRFLAGMTPIPSQKNPAFKEDEIAAMVRNSPKRYCIKHIREDFLEEERQKALLDETYSACTAANPALMGYVMERYDAMTAEQKNAFLEKAVKREQDAKVDEVVRTKYDEIKEDMLTIFAREGINEFEEEKKTSKGRQGGFEEIPENMSIDDIHRAGQI